MGFFIALFFIIFTLKLCGAIAISWWWLLAPGLAIAFFWTLLVSILLMSGIYRLVIAGEMKRRDRNGLDSEEQKITG